MKDSKWLQGWEIPAIFNAAASLWQYNNIKNQPIAKYDGYYDNKLANDASRRMNSLTIDSRPIIRKIADLDARMRKAISMSGGTAGQKYLARVASNANTQMSIADMMPKINDMLNLLRVQSANFDYALGEADRQHRMNSYDKYFDFYSKAHAAKQAGMQTELRNFADTLWNAYGNAFTYKTYKDTLGMYLQDLKLRDQELRMLANTMNSQRR